MIFDYLFYNKYRHLSKMSKIPHFLNAPSWNLVQNDQRGIPQLFSHAKTISTQLFFNILFPQHLCSGSPFLPSLRALGRVAGIWVPPPPRATRTALLLLLLLLLLSPPPKSKQSWFQSNQSWFQSNQSWFQSNQSWFQSKQSWFQSKKSWFRSKKTIPPPTTCFCELVYPILRIVQGLAST